MFKTMLASTALAGFLVSGAAFAQDAPAADEILPAPDGAVDAPAPALDDPAMPGDDAFADEEWTAVELNTLTADDLRGAEIRSASDDQVIGTVGDVQFADDGATVDGIHGDFGQFLGAGAEQITAPGTDFEAFRGADDRIMLRTGLTREDLEGMRDGMEAPEAN